MSVPEEARYRAVMALGGEDDSAVELLVQALHDPGWRVRRLAVEKMVEVLPTPVAIGRLLRVLGERGETGARNAAAHGLVCMGRSAVQALEQLSLHPDADQRKFAADILGELRAPEGASALVRALEDVDPNVRASAAEALGRVGGPEAERALVQLLSADDDSLRFCALEGLWELRCAPALPALVALMDDEFLRAGAHRLLGFVAQPAAVTAIGRGLGSTAIEVQEAALEALGVHAETASGEFRSLLEAEARASLRRLANPPEFICRSLAHSRPSVRAGAVFLGGLSDDLRLLGPLLAAAAEPRLAELVCSAVCRLGPRAGRHLLDLVDRLPEPSRSLAMEVLEELSDPSLVPALGARLDKPDSTLTPFVLAALGKSRALEALPWLTRWLADPDFGDDAGRALDQLAKTYPEQAWEQLEPLLRETPTPALVMAASRVGGLKVLEYLSWWAGHPEPNVRAAALLAAGHVGASESFELLRTAMGDEEAQVRRAACSTLGALEPTRSQSLLELGLVDPDASVRVAAVGAIGEGGVVALAHRLETLTRSEHGQLAMEAVRALGRLGRLTPATLREAAVHPDPEVAKQALRSGSDSSAAVSLGQLLLRSSQWDVRLEAARVLQSSGDHGCLPAIREALRGEEDPLARRALVEAERSLQRR